MKWGRQVRGGINGSRAVVCIKMERYLYLLKQHDLRFQKYRLPKRKAFCLYSSGRQHLGSVWHHRQNDTNTNLPHCNSPRKLRMNWSGMKPSQPQRAVWQQPHQPGHGVETEKIIYFMYSVCTWQRTGCASTSNTNPVRVLKRESHDFACENREDWYIHSEDKIQSFFNVAAVVTCTDK
jgi:hypothetical protein